MLDFLRHLLDRTFLDPRAPQVHAITNLFWVGAIVATIFLIIPSAALIYTMIRFRHRPGQEDPPPVYGNHKLEITWTVVPLVIVLGIFGLSVSAMRLSSPSTDPPPRQTASITIIGHQWWWEIRYPSGVVTANEIHIPTHQQLLVDLKSADVVHGFWVPQVASQMYLEPGQTNQIWLQADRAGTYLGQCAEFCGSAHAWMLLRVVAQSPAAFDAWQRAQLGRAVGPGATTGKTSTQTIAEGAQPATQTPTRETGANASEFAQGATLFQQLSCQVCHAIDGTAAHGVVGPDLTHFGSRQSLAAGRLSNTPTHLATWLRNPDALKPGVHMPNLLLTDPQIRALTTYLEGLK